MKRLFTLLLIMSISSLWCMAQDVNFDRLMKEYSTKSKCTTINISNAMLRSMGVDISAESVRAIAIEDAELIPHAKSQIVKLVSKYEVVMQVNSDDESVDIYQKADASEKVTDLLIVTTSKDECMMLYIYGNGIKVEDATELINF